MSERDNASRLDAAIVELLRGERLEAVLARTEPELAPYLRLFDQLQAVQSPIEGPSEEFRLRLRARFVQGANRETRLDRGRGSRMQRAAVAGAASLLLGSALNPALAHELVSQVRETMGRAAADVLNAALFTERRGESRGSAPHAPLADEKSPAHSGSTELTSQTKSKGGPFLPTSHSNTADEEARPGFPMEAPISPVAQPLPETNEPGVMGDSPVVYSSDPGQQGAFASDNRGPESSSDPGAVHAHAPANLPAPSHPATTSGVETQPGDSKSEAPPVDHEDSDGASAGESSQTEEPEAGLDAPGFNPPTHSAADEGPPGLGGEVPPGHGGSLPVSIDGGTPPGHSAASEGPPGLQGELPPGHGGTQPNQHNQANTPRLHSAASGDAPGPKGNGASGNSAANDDPPGQAKSAGTGESMVVPMTAEPGTPGTAGQPVHANGGKSAGTALQGGESAGELASDDDATSGSVSTPAQGNAGQGQQGNGNQSPGPKSR